MYSERNEEEFLAQYFRDLNNGYFVDLGANDGKNLSNTRMLFEKGWSGLCVEADPRTFEVLKQTYPDGGRVKTLHTAVWNKPGEVVFFQHREFCSGVSSLFADLNFDHWKPINVRCTTLDLILNQIQPVAIDFLAIDVEGCDYDIVAGYSWRIKPKLIMIEHDKRTVEAFDALFAAAGYKRIFQNVSNAAYSE